MEVTPFGLAALRPVVMWPSMISLSWPDDMSGSVTAESPVLRAEISSDVLIDAWYGRTIQSELTECAGSFAMQNVGPARATTDTGSSRLRSAPRSAGSVHENPARAIRAGVALERNYRERRNDAVVDARVSTCS
jgi:hypothetical protein